VATEAFQLQPKASISLGLQAARSPRTRAVDAAGGLRVEALLDQTQTPAAEFTTEQLEQAWAGGSGPGKDEDGHGTYVASIAAGSRFGALEGVAPGGRLLLVKTDFRNTDQAVSWVFGKAGNRPCVVNLSLGHHFGAHDGTDVEERLHSQLTGPGKIIVVSAGNERTDDLHIGGSFVPGQSDQVVFDLQRQPDGRAVTVLTLWHAREDRFTISLGTPLGEVITEAEPALGNGVTSTFGAATTTVSQQRYQPSNLIQHQIEVELGVQASNIDLRDWRVGGPVPQRLDRTPRRLVPHQRVRHLPPPAPVDRDRPHGRPNSHRCRLPRRSQPCQPHLLARRRGRPLRPRVDAGPVQLLQQPRPHSRRSPQARPLRAGSAVAGGALGRE
jgi:subtilase family protein